MADENILVPIEGNRTYIYDFNKNVMFPVTGIRSVLMEDNLSTLEDFVYQVRDFIDKGITGEEAEQLRSNVTKALNSMTSINDSITSINKELVDLYAAIGVEVGVSGLIYNRPLYKSFTSRSKQGETNVELLSYSNNPLKLNPDKFIIIKINLIIKKDNSNEENYVELVYRANVGSSTDTNALTNIKLLKTSDESVSINLSSEVNENKIYLKAILNATTSTTLQGNINIDEI